MNNLLFTTKFLDRLAYQGKELDFADIIERDGKKWLVYDPVDPKNPWTLAEVGDHLRIPLVPQLTKDCDPNTALGYAWKLGFEAACAILVSGARPSAVHVSLGTPIEQLHDPASGYPLHFRFWMGIAVKLES